MELLRKHGLVYHSNLMDADLPYCHKTPYGELVELPTAWVNDDWVYFGFSAVPPVGNGIWSQEDVFEIWKEEFEGAYEEGGFFNVMGHPQVIGRPSRTADGRAPDPAHSREEATSGSRAAHRDRGALPEPAVGGHVGPGVS